MKQTYLALGLGLLLTACNQHPEKGDFKINVQLDNAPLTHISLEQLSMEDIKVVDSLTLRDPGGKFTLKGIVPEQGLYRIHFGNEKDKDILLALDAGDMQIKGDYNNLDKITVTGSEATTELQGFIHSMTEKGQALDASIEAANNLKDVKGSDSLYQVKSKDAEDQRQSFIKWFLDFAKNTSSPVNAAFALGNTNLSLLAEHQQEIDAIGKKFPTNTLLKGLVAKVDETADQENTKKATDGDQPSVKDGQEAPDFTLDTPDGKSISLKSLRGKYVLVDFWASWCQPCRAENPNVVAAFNEFKGKNFAILGVSLDKDKAAWQKAISDDHLTWTHVSDLKFWDSKVVGLYGIQGIPYNFLLDPQGKVVASNLRGPALQEKLKSVLQ
ncbi:Peroxiredoxin [Chitinophaga costaii]|uniref:Peroxiredoxin n=1 Tax=Chitinophaga costaii TaxID=1335309 RepID=A0A1C4DXJ9_9BACT|nr:TlpA disulfide reductase family protein [Chitinophaga costaii]PUZ27852.1 AhpC/TSA family protein [Chitinophaga costaii]SCC36073.1 Peroxiredoxin [Chitinophaga costaii]